MPLHCAEEVCNSDNALFNRLGRLRAAVRRAKGLPLLFVCSVRSDIFTPGVLVQRRRDIGDSVDVSFALTLRANLPSLRDYLTAANTSVCIRHYLQPHFQAKLEYILCLSKYKVWYSHTKFGYVS